MGSITAAQICITQTDELKWLNWAGWSEKGKKMNFRVNKETMGTAKGTLFIFHTEIITELTFLSIVTAL